MRLAFPSPDGMLTGLAPFSRGSVGFTVTGSVVAVDGGVAKGTLGCGEGGRAVVAWATALPLAAGRGWSTLQPSADSAASDAATPPVMYETRFRSSRREIRPSV